MTVLAHRYVLAAPLGRSAGAVVHAATDRRLQRPVAVTVVPPTSPARPQATVTRAHTAAGLTHPNLLTVLDAGEAPDGAFVVTDRLEGTTLAHRLADGPMSRAETVAMLDAVLAALEGLHGHGLALGGFAPWQVRRGVDGMWALAALPACDDDAAPLPLGGPVPEIEEPEVPPARSAAALRAADLAAVGMLTVAALTGRVPRAQAEPEPTSLSAIDDEGLRALAADALAGQQQAAAAATPAITATALRRRLPGGAPAGLPATLGLPAPAASTLARHAGRPAVQRLRRMARALTGAGSAGR